MAQFSLSPARKSAAPLFAFLFLISMVGVLSFPIRALYITKELGGSTFENGLTFAMPAIIALFVLPIIGDISDRFKERRILICAGMIIIGIAYLLTSFATAAWMVLALGCVAMPFMSAANAQFFAWAREREELRFGDQATGSAELRMGFIAGWVVGPALAGAILSLGFTYRDIFQMQTAGYACLAALIWVFAKAPKTISQDQSERFSWLRWRQVPPNLLMIALFVAFLMSGDIVRLANLSLFIDANISSDPMALTIAFAATPIVELPAAALCIYIAKRTTKKLVLGIGLVAAIIHFALFPFVQTLEQVIAFQALYALLPASALGVGIGYAQECAPKRMGFATSFVFAGQTLAILIGGSIATFGGLFLTVEMTYLAPLFFILIAAYVWTKLKEL